MHALLNFHVHPTICCKVMEFVLLNYLNGYDGEGKTHIFEAVKGCVQVEVFDVSYNKYYAWHGNSGIKEEL